MKLWFVSMECANIAEAGGVKNVTFSLCNEFARLGHDVTLFIPVFKCNSWDKLTKIEKNLYKSNIQICQKEEIVSYTKAVFQKSDFKVVLINNEHFAEKEAVYTYTEKEEKVNPKHKKGEGHEDALLIDSLFQKSVCNYLKYIDLDSVPDLIHCQDASTAILPAYLKETAYPQIKTLITIHNAGPFYHHEFKNLEDASFYTGLPQELLKNSMNGQRVEPFLIGLNSGANLMTVSKDYALELKDPSNCEFTDGLSKIFHDRKIKIKGITNGFDFDRYNPSKIEVSKLPFAFNPEIGDFSGKYKIRKFFIEEVVNSSQYPSDGIEKFGKLEVSADCKKEFYIAYHGRVTSQKGISVLTSAIPHILSENENVRFVIAGQGEPKLEEELAELTRKYSGKIVYLNGYNQSVVRMAIASCDFIVLPSYFEPCGLEDFISQAFATLPVAHKTGGLNKILNGKTGFLYKNNTSRDLAETILKVIKLNDEKIMKIRVRAAKYVHDEYIWKTVVEKKYLKYFKEILRKK